MNDKKRLSAFYQDGKVLVNREFLALYFKVDKTTVTKWATQKGLEKHDKTYYDLRYVIDWYSKNINQTYSNKSRKEIINEDEILDAEAELKDFLKTLPKELAIVFEVSAKDPMDKMKDLKEIEKKTIENKIKSGEYIPADKLDIGMAELSAIQVGFYGQDLHQFPRELEYKSASEIQEVLNKEYSKRFKDLHKIMNIKSVKKISDIMEVLTRKLTTYSADELIKYLEKLK